MRTKNVTFLILFFTFFLKKGYSQDTLPLYELHFSQQIIEDVANSKIRKSRAAWRYTYIGREKEAIDMYDYGVEDRWGFDTLTQEGLLDLQRYQPIDAKTYILEQAAKHQMLIISESHVLPAHRHFLKQMLPELVNMGYDYFGLETLANCDFIKEMGWSIPCDSAISKRGYPLFSPAAGTYIREPRMSNLIRKGHELGLKIFSYEQFSKDRELGQAKNIKKILDKDPNARIIILCGFGHLIEAFDEETKYNNGKIMAYHLKQMTGIDPLTVNQYVLSEAALGRETPHYRYINAPGPSVLVDPEGKTYTGFPRHNKFDMLVFHPRMQYVYQRPSYLYNDPDYLPYFIPKEKIKIDYPIIVKAMNVKELKDAVPIDVIELRNEGEIIPLILPQGSYKIILINPQKEVQELKVELK